MSTSEAKSINIRKIPPISERQSPSTIKIPEFSLIPAPVLEAYVDGDAKKTNGETTRMMAPKSKIVDPIRSQVQEINNGKTGFDVSLRKDSISRNAIDLPPIEFNASYHKAGVAPKGKVKIADLIKNAADGSTIMIPVGVYTENLKITKSLCLDSKGVVTISSTAKKPVITIAGGKVTMKNMIIEQKCSENIESVIVESGSVCFDTCTITNFGSNAFSIVGNASIFAKKCKINCEKGSCFILSDKAAAQIIDTTLISSETDAFIAKNHSRFQLENTQISSQKANGITCYDYSSFVIDTCKIFGCGKNGIEITSENNCQLIIQSAIDGCQFAGVVLAKLSTVQIIGCRIIGCIGAAFEIQDGSAALSKNNYIERCGTLSSIKVRDSATLESFVDIFSNIDCNCFVIAHNSLVSLSELSIIGVKGYGVYCSDAANVTITKSSFTHIMAAAIIGLKGTTICINDSIIANPNQFGIVLKGCGVCSITNTQITGAGFTGIEVENIQNLSIDGCTIIESSQCGLSAINSSIKVQNTALNNNLMCGIEVFSSTVVFEKLTLISNTHMGIILKESSSLSMKNSIINDHMHTAISVEGKSKAVIENSEFCNNAGQAVAIMRQSLAILSSSKLSGHGSIVFQIEGRSSKLKLLNCELFENHTAILSSDSSVVSVKGCLFYKNWRHIEGKIGSIIKLKSSTFKECLGPLSLHICDEAKGIILNCQIHDNNGIGICCSSNVNISKSKLFKNGAMAVYCHLKSNTHISENSIFRNGDFGIYIQEGEAIILNNQIDCHASVGVMVGSSANVEIDQNHFENNGLLNINKE